MRDQEKQPRKSSTCSAPGSPTARRNGSRLTEEGILQVVSKWTGIPLQRMEQGEAQRLPQDGGRNVRTVVGQKRRSHVPKRCAVSRADLKDPAPPHAPFALLGPTGWEDAPGQDPGRMHVWRRQKPSSSSTCPNTWSANNASRMIGSPPGYVGTRTAATDRAGGPQPYSVILFDEVEKAHPDVTTCLLQILERAS